MDVVYYDITRLLARHSAPTPTGIDRVDIRYANHYLQQKVEQRFVYQKNATFYYLSKKKSSKLINLLYDKWITNNAREQNEHVLSNIYNTTIGNKENTKIQSKKIQYIQKITPSLTKGQFNAVDGYLMDILVKDRDKKSYYINTSHHGVGHADAYYVFKTLGKLRIIFYLHDIIPIDYPEYVRIGDDKNHEKRVSAMANFSDAILVNSNYTKNRFLSFCDKKQYRHPPVHISYIGVEDSFVRLLQKSNTSETGIKISKNYFVTVSTIEPRKNHLMLLQIWREMIEHKVENIPQLIILGKRGWNVDNVLDFLERSPSLKSYVIELSGVSDKQLVDILRNAKGMLFPSFVEGWGMPLVEALAMKIPVICSDIEAFRESGQMLAKYISPIDAKCWQNEIIKISNNSDYRNGLIKKIDSFKLPTWDECFRKLDEFISQIEEKNFYQAPINTAAFKVAHQINLKNDFDANKDSSFQKKIKKLKRDPQKFFLDSKIWILRYVGKKLEKY